MQSRAVSGSITVPAPISTSSSLYLRESSSISLMAPGTVIVTSMVVIPPATTASTADLACSSESARITGSTPQSTMRLITSSLLIIDRRRFKSRSKQVNYKQSNKICRSGDNKDRNVAAGALQYIADD